MEGMGEALEGIRILDLTQGVAGPYCTKLFSDYGAEILKIERPGLGDPTRRAGPFPNDEPHPERSGLFLDLNTGKQSITLNLKTKTGQRILRHLVREADLVFESFRPGTLARLGLDSNELKAASPAATLVSISNFGQFGPNRDLEADDMLMYAMSGGQAVTGVPGREPNKLGLYAPLFYAGATAATIAFGAYMASYRSGIGERVDISIQEVLATSMDRAAQNLMSLEYSGALHRTVEAHHRASAFPGGVYGGQLPCKDGYITIMCYPHWWDRFCRMIDRSDLIDDERYINHLQEPDFGPEIDALFLPWVLERTKAEVMQEAQSEGVPVAALHTMADIFEDPQLRERKYFTWLNHPEAGPLEYPGPPFKLSKTPARIRRAPLLAEHTVEVLTNRLGYSNKDVVILRQRGVV